MSIWRWGASFAAAISTGVSVGWSNFLQTKNPIWGLGSGITATICEGANYFFFQGASMDSDSQDYQNLPEIDQAPKEKGWCSTAASIMGQFLYTSLDATKSFFDRYFLLRAIFALFCWNPTSPIFWVCLSSGVIKQLFNMAHETYETSETIAQALGNANDKPYYSDLFKKCCCSPRVIKAFRTLGSLEHAVIDDTASIIACIPKDVIDYLIANPGIGSAPLIVTLILTYLLYRQTEFFEGKHAEDNINKSTGINTQTPVKLSIREINMLECGLKMAAPVHGVATAMPVYLTLLELMKEMPAGIKWPLSITSAWICAIFAGVGSWKSEYKEAKDQLDEARKITNSINTVSANVI